MAIQKKRKTLKIQITIPEDKKETQNIPTKEAIPSFPVIFVFGIAKSPQRTTAGSTAHSRLSSLLDGTMWSEDH